MINGEFYQYTEFTIEVTDTTKVKQKYPIIILTPLLKLIISANKNGEANSKVIKSCATQSKLCYSVIY